MVKYKVRSFYEKDTGTAGADIIIFDDEGDVVDTLLVTTESTYNDLVSQLEGIDEKYVDRNEVLALLQNNIYTTDEIIEINATLLGGHSSDYFAQREHNHDQLYTPLSHTKVLGNASTAGHTKVINNLSRGSYQEGESLSAYQGKILDNKINTQVTNLNNKINNLSGNMPSEVGIVNNLTSTDTNKALSANMGKSLQDNKLNKSDIINNLTSNDTNKALSAAMGKSLKSSIDTAQSGVNSIKNGNKEPTGNRWGINTSFFSGEWKEMKRNGFGIL